MNSVLRTDTVRLKQDHDQVDQLIQDMKARVGEMKSTIDKLNGMWEGSAKTIFKNACKSDLAKTADVIKEAENLTRYLSQANYTYVKYEKHAASLADSIGM